MKTWVESSVMAKFPAYSGDVQGWIKPVLLGFQSGQDPGLLSSSLPRLLTPFFTSFPPTQDEVIKVRSKALEPVLLGLNSGFAPS